VTPAEPAVLALHNGAGVSACVATDRVPESIAAAVLYADTGLGSAAPTYASFEGVEY
jgi:hypothetical protein